MRGNGPQETITMRLYPEPRIGPKNKPKGKLSVGTQRNQGRIAMGARNALPLPRSYFTPNDTVCIQLKTTASVANGAVSGLATRAIALSPISLVTTDYLALGNLFPVLLGLQGSYARFMISRLKVDLLCTSPYTSGGFMAANFEADSTGVSGPPTSLTDCTNAVHSCLATPGAPGTYTVDVAQYFGDWRNSKAGTGDPDSVVDAGVIQMYCSNASAVGAGIGLLTIEVDFYFAGYRSTS